MLHTSLRVIHQTPRFTVSKFESASPGGHVVVIERLNGAGETTNLRTLVGAEATKFLHDRRAAIDGALNDDRTIAKPFVVDSLIQRDYF